MRKQEAISRAPRPKMNIAGIPFFEFRPSKKLFKPKNSPAIKLGVIKNFFYSKTIFSS